MSSAQPGVLDLANLGFEQGAHLLVKQTLKSLQPGEELGVTGADPALVVHLEAWCRANGHRVRQALDSDFGVPGFSEARRTWTGGLVPSVPERRVSTALWPIPRPSGDWPPAAR
jgi:hypothetical protein